ncbi:MAG TPA: hypothetical protein VE197_11320, partial [Mycobacterium sp.]|nr:hypothetical protein [Mycobacterium sp.]
MLLTGGVALTAVVGFAGPASAVNNNPAGNPTSPAVTYEADCTSSLQAGVAAPFVTATVINTTSDTVAPTGGTFGVAGSVTQELPGAVIAGLNAALGPPTLGLDVVQTFGSTDGNATGTYPYSKNFAPVTTPGGQVTGVNAASGATTLSGDFTGVPAGAFLSSGLTTGIANGTVATAAGTATSITISIPTTAALSAATVGWAPQAGLSFTDSTFASPANAFTTSGTNGGTAGIGLVSSTSFTLVMTPTVEFGGATGVGTANCLQTGWVDATTPGPAQTDETAPALPYGSITPLLTATPTFQPGAYVNLSDTPPSPNDQTVSLGQGGTGSVTLTATAG